MRFTDLEPLCFELGAESFCMFSGLENPCFGNLQNPATNSCTNATYHNKPFLLGVPARDVRIWLYRYIYLLHSWYNYYIYAPLTPRHLLRFRQSFASARCTNFQLLTHHLSYHQEFKIMLWHLRSTFDVRLLWPLQTNAIFQITTPISHRIVGINKCSKDNLGHSLHYQL